MSAPKCTEEFWHELQPENKPSKVYADLSMFAGNAKITVTGHKSGVSLNFCGDDFAVGINFRGLDHLTDVAAAIMKFAGKEWAHDEWAKELEALREAAMERFGRCSRRKCPEVAAFLYDNALYCHRHAPQLDRPLGEPDPE